MRKYKKDLCILLIISLVGIAFLLVTYGSQKKDAKVVVRVDGEEQVSYQLSDTVTETIQGVGGKNTLEIKDGKSRLIEADCPDQICVNTGSIQYVGQSIICLPHRVVVEIQE